VVSRASRREGRDGASREGERGAARGARERTQWLERVHHTTHVHPAPALGPLCEGATSCGVSVARERWKVEARGRGARTAREVRASHAYCAETRRRELRKGRALRGSP
jgi:hypothetical protein